MNARLRLANGAAMVVLPFLVAFGGHPKIWVFLFHLTAALLALLAARSTAGATLRGWAIGTNAWCLILDALVLAALAHGVFRGRAPWSWQPAVAIGAPLALATLCALNLRTVATRGRNGRPCRVTCPDARNVERAAPTRDTGVMCTYVLAVLLKSVDLAALDAVARRFGRCVSKFANGADEITPSLAKGEQVFGTTPGHCDCGTVLGSACLPAGRRADPSHEAAKLRRKGWSEARIARSLAQAEAARTHDADGQRESTAEELARWRGFLAAALDSKLTDRIGLLWIDANLGDGYRLDGRENLRVEEATDQRLAQLARDRLYVFRR